MTGEEFKSIVEDDLNLKQKQIAERWGVSRQLIGKLYKAQEVPQQWDDAIMRIVLERKLEQLDSVENSYLSEIKIKARLEVKVKALMAAAEDIMSVVSDSKQQTDGSKIRTIDTQ